MGMTAQELIDKLQAWKKYEPDLNDVMVEVAIKPDFMDDGLDDYVWLEINDLDKPDPDSGHCLIHLGEVTME